MSFVEQFLFIQQNIRLYHWTTPIYNQHIVSGELYEKLDKLFDKFIETYMGKFNKIQFKKITTVSEPLTDKTILSLLKKFKQFLLADLEFVLSSEQMTNNDLKNIRDDILGEVNQFIFLLRLK